jgi:hypothetical protein
LGYDKGRVREDKKDKTREIKDRTPASPGEGNGKTRKRPG